MLVKDPLFRVDWMQLFNEVIYNNDMIIVQYQCQWLLEQI